MINTMTTMIIVVTISILIRVISSKVIATSIIVIIITSYYYSYTQEEYVLAGNTGEQLILPHTEHLPAKCPGLLFFTMSRVQFGGFRAPV